MDSNKLSPVKVFPGATRCGELGLAVIYSVVLGSGIPADGDEPYPSLSDYHDYEPKLEFDDTELHQTPNAIAHTGKSLMR